MNKINLKIYVEMKKFETKKWTLNALQHSVVQCSVLNSVFEFWKNNLKIYKRICV